MGSCLLGAAVAAHQRAQLTQRIDDLQGWAPNRALCLVGEVHTAEQAPGQRWVVRVNAKVQGSSITGRFRVSVLAGPGVPVPLTGDRVVTCGHWQPPFGFFNPGARDPYTAGAVFGDCGRLQATSWRRVATGQGPRRWAALARRSLASALDRLPPERASFLRATVLGERAAVAAEVEAGFKAAGATHALSVSGLHLAAVAVLFFVGLRWAAVRVPALALRIPPQVLAGLLSAPAVVFYTLMTGEAVATWRSAFMACIVFAAYVVRRAPALGTSIAVAALAIGAHSVFWLWDISFQLSLASVVALAAFARALGPTPTHEALAPRRRLQLWLWRGSAATLAAGLATGPLVAHHFGEITPAAILGNLTLTPLVELLVVPVGLVASGVGALDERLGRLPLWAADHAAGLTMAVARGFAAVAPVWRVNPPDVAQTMLASAAAVAGLAAFRWSPRSRERRRMFVCAGVLGASLGGLSWAGGWWRSHDDRVRVTFLDVGQGDAAVVEGPNGFVAVIDAGGLGESFDTGARIVGPYLRRQGVRAIDLLVLSHPHPDHAQGLPHLLEAFSVKALWMPVHEDGPSHDGPLIAQLRALAARRGTLVPEPHSFVRDGLVMRPLSPWAADRIAAPEGLSVNDASLTVHLSYAGRSIFFAGDLEGPGELELAERSRELGLQAQADVLKAPHHGSRTSSSDDLLSAVSPRLVVVSAGRGNRFGFPHAEVLQRYAGRHLRVLRTDLHGAIQLEWDGQRQRAPRISCVLGCASQWPEAPR